MVQYFFSVAIAFAFFQVSALSAQTASPQQPGEPSVEIGLFSAPDDSSQLVESVKKGETLKPLAETMGSEGVNWYMVQTKGGVVGWVNGWCQALLLLYCSAQIEFRLNKFLHESLTTVREVFSSLRSPLGAG